VQNFFLDLEETQLKTAWKEEEIKLITARKADL